MPQSPSSLSTRHGPRASRAGRGSGRTSRAALLPLAMAAVLVACGSDEPDPQGADDQVAEATSPLTGQTVRGGLPAHPVVVVKIDNTDSSRPQVGLGEASLVVEQLVEGGITRLAAFFYERVPDVAGPVRSMRASDVGIVAPADGVLVASGGAAPTVARLREAGIGMVTESGAGFYRDDARPSLYSLMVRLPELVGTLEEAPAPQPYLPFDAAAELPEGKPALGLAASFADGSATRWRFAEGRYASTDSRAAEGDGFEPATVLVLRVDVGDAGYLDPAGNPVPETRLVGSGAALVFHDGRLVRGTWSKGDLDDPVSLGSGGSALSLPPGKVWVELVPKKGGAVSVMPD